MNSAVNLMATKAQEKISFARLYPPSLEFAEHINLYFTTDKSEKEKAYALRYQVLTKEQNRTAHADHLLQIYNDSMDDSVNHLLVARYEKQIIATLRIVFRRDQKVIDEDQYCFEDLGNLLSLAEPVALNEIAVAARGAISPDFRGIGLYSAMWQVAYEFCRMNKIKVLTGAIDSANEQLVALHSKQGWRPYRSKVNCFGMVVDFIAKVI